MMRAASRSRTITTTAYQIFSSTVGNRILVSSPSTLFTHDCVAGRYCIRRFLGSKKGSKRGRRRQQGWLYRDDQWAEHHHPPKATCCCYPTRRTMALNAAMVTRGSNNGCTYFLIRDTLSHRGAGFAGSDAPWPWVRWQGEEPVRERRVSSQEERMASDSK